MIWLDLAILLTCILWGARLGGVGMGTMAALGMGLLVFGLGRTPGNFPGEVLLIVLCVVTAAATLQAAGGVTLMVGFAENVLRRNPQWIIFLAPFISYLFTFLCGSSHVVYSVLPIIAEVSRKVKERPERPLSISVIASQAAVTASPLSAATAGMVALLAKNGQLGLRDVLIICVPSTLAGVVAGAFAVRKMGPELEQDQEYLTRLARGDFAASQINPAQKTSIPPRATWSIGLFVGASVLVTLLGLFPNLRPDVTIDGATEKLSMVTSISLVSLSAAALILIVSGIKPALVASGSIMRAGIVAIISILGIAWLGSTFFEAHQAQVLGGIVSHLQAYPWLFAVVLFFLSILLYSQAASVAALMGLGIQLGIEPPLLIAMFPAVNGIFFLPTNATEVAAIQFDSTGTTSIGKWVLNHSFMRAGLISTIVSVAVGFAIAKALY
jgi:anaerobic C4-dicarboxylate transporter DcuA